MESTGTKSGKQDTSSSSGNYLTHVVNADIKPINDQVPLAEIQLTAQHNVFANKQHHTEQSEPIYDTYLLKNVDSNTTPDSTNMCHKRGEIDQNAKHYQVKCPFPNAEFFKMKDMVEKEVYNELSNKFLQLEKHCISFEISIQQKEESFQSNKPFSLTPYVPPSKKDYEILFQPLFNEYFNPPPHVVSPDPATVAAPKAVDLAGSPSSTTIDQDVPSASTSPTNQEIQFQVTHQDPSSKETTLQGFIPSNLHHLNQSFDTLTKLTKNHPLENVIGDPSRSVLTRSLLQRHAIWCYFKANDNPILLVGNGVVEIYYLKERIMVNWKDLPRDNPLVSVEVLRYDIKSSKSENKGIASTEMELVLEQTQQGTSHDVSVSIEGVEE
nr:hypothetical protein [Tanacetum cinerariifolium]